MCGHDYSNDVFSSLKEVYQQAKKDKKLVIGYAMHFKDGSGSYQVELWDLIDKLLIFRHSSTYAHRTLEYMPREQIEDAIELVEIERYLCTQECIDIKQFLNKDELESI